MRFAKGLHRQELHQPEGQRAGVGHDDLRAAVGPDFPCALSSWPIARYGLNPPSPPGLSRPWGMPGSEERGRPREEGGITRAQFEAKGRLPPAHSTGTRRH